MFTIAKPFVNTLIGVSSVLLLTACYSNRYYERIAEIEAEYAVNVAKAQKEQANLPPKQEPKTYEEKMLALQEEQLRMLEQQKIDNLIHRYDDSTHNRVQKVYFDSWIGY